MIKRELNTEKGEQLNNAFEEERPKPVSSNNLNKQRSNQFKDK